MFLGIDVGGVVGSIKATLEAGGFVLYRGQEDLGGACTTPTPPL